MVVHLQLYSVDEQISAPALFLILASVVFYRFIVIVELRHEIVYMTSWQKCNSLLHFWICFMESNIKPLHVKQVAHRHSHLRVRRFKVSGQPPDYIISMFAVELTLI